MFSLKKKTTLDGITEMVRTLNKLDKDVTKNLRNDLKEAVKPTAMSIASSVPTVAPLSGFNHSGRTRWSGARGSVGFTPLSVRKDKKINPLVSIRIQGRGSGAGFDIAEIAGSRGNKFSKRSKARADQFVRSLDAVAPYKFKAGRFAFGEFLKEKKPITKEVIKILEKVEKIYNKKLRKMN